MSSDTTMAVGLLGILAGASLLFVVWYVFQLIAGWKVYVKMGEPGWKSLIPIYGGYVMYTHIWTGTMYWVSLVCMLASYWLNSMTANGGSSILSLLSMAAGIASFVIGIISSNKLSKAFGHGVGFTIGLVFLKPIFYLILGFGSSQYMGNSSNYTNYNNY